MILNGISKKLLHYWLGDYKHMPFRCGRTGIADLNNLNKLMDKVDCRLSFVESCVIVVT